MEDMILPPKRQAVVDRLRRRIETYRRRQSECVPRFDQSFTGACEQQNLETSALQKRFLEAKTKRQAKKSDRKPDLPAISGNLHSSVHVQQKFGCGDYEPPAKLQCGVGGGGGAGEALTKFSVEIVQQLEFTTSAADSQPQQISTNVTVKALANAVKTSGSPPPPQPPRAPTPLDCERECKAECKSEVADDEFVGLDECAAALERDAASAFPGLADLIGEDDGDDAFEDLITEISEYPEFMKDFDLDGGKAASAEPAEGETPRAYCGATGGEMSPAAQTLKHMAEQHQAAAGGDWRYRGAYAGYRARAPEHLHIHQHQQLHIQQPHHNLQVSAAQHMQASVGGGHVSVAAQQGMYASFQHQPSPQHHQGAGCESYSVSQSQSINFGQVLRARPAPAPAQPAPPHQPLANYDRQAGVVAAGISREQQAKMLQQQQQQMLRAQQQMRPPPPEYKARFANTGVPGVLARVEARAHAAAGRRQAAVPAPPSRIRHGRHGRWHVAAAAATDAAAAGAAAATATNAASATTDEPTISDVASHYATTPDDERARTDAEYPHEPVTEHVDAARHGRHGTPGQSHAERTHGSGRHARAAQPHAELHDGTEQPHGTERAHARSERPYAGSEWPYAESEWGHARSEWPHAGSERAHAGRRRAGRQRLVPVAAHDVFLHGAARGLQPGLPRQHAFHGRQQPHGAGAAQLARQLLPQRHPLSPAPPPPPRAGTLYFLPNRPVVRAIRSVRTGRYS